MCYETSICYSGCSHTQPDSTNVYRKAAFDCKLSNVHQVPDDVCTGRSVYYGVANSSVNL